MKCQFVFLFLCLAATEVYSCVCAPSTITHHYQQATFVAKARIISLSADLNDKEYHDADIEIITLYKGPHLGKVKVNSSLNSSCAFLPAINSVWLIFATEWQGKLSFHYCTGSLQADRSFDNNKFPNAIQNYSKTIALKEEVLEFLKSGKYMNPNPYGLYAYNEALGEIKGFSNKNTFAVFQVDLDKERSVTGIRVLRKFKSGALTKTVYNSLLKNLKLFKQGTNSISGNSQLLLFCFFYREPKASTGWLSFNDL